MPLKGQMRQWNTIGTKSKTSPIRGSIIIYTLGAFGGQKAELNRGTLVNVLNFFHQNRVT